MRVEILHVSRRFGHLTALDDVSVEFATASRTALVGPNGSGKSTLVRILMGLLRREGSVRIDGLDPLRDRSRLASRVAYMPQVAPRLHATVSQLTHAVARLRAMDTKPIVEVAERLHLDLEATGRKPFRTLSGGMRQKLLAAFALGVGAELLVLDEPTASMDAESRERFFDLVQQLEPRPTVVLCSHRFEELRSLVDDVAVLQDGRLVRFGSNQELLVATGRSVVELRTSNDRADEFLRALGFERRGTEWWRVLVVSSDRGLLVKRLSDELGASLDDIIVRDVEELPRGQSDTGEESP
ncbi:MAG: ABC transporter ATP-binding protein [Planctomycetes bacterium]|nr:ABC transporter ATP-binding protein [Planctomycetota bacterium]